MRKQKQKYLLKLIIEFVKLNIAGNILFWGTYLGYFVFDMFFQWPELQALATASILAHILFFVVDKTWVFADTTGRRKTSGELVRFGLFMGFSYFLNLGIVRGLSEFGGISPYYGQFIAAAFFIFWNFIGLRWWVFYEMRHMAITLHKPRGSRKYGKKTK